MNALMNGSRFNLLPASDMTRQVSRWINELTDETSGTCPAPVSIWENDTHYQLEFDLPGVSGEDVDVKVRENTLYVSATRPIMTDVQFLRQERSFGTIQRQFQLPSRVDDSDIHAELTGGVLKIEVAKAPESQVKKIEVKAL